MKQLSILIPCYNAEPYIQELLECIDKQISEEVEVILIDDGSSEPVKADYEWLKLIRQDNSGISKTRNRLLSEAQGEYIWFIDADDLITDNAISYILNRINSTDFDYMDLSWKSLEDNSFNYRLSSDQQRLPNPSACTRIFKRSFIGDNRFPEHKDAAEDEHFTRRLDLGRGKHISAMEYIYLYRITIPGSNSKRFIANETNTKRIGYYFRNVTSDMTYLIDELKEADEENEVILLTHSNALPELRRYAQIISPPRPYRVMEARGESCDYLNIIEEPLKTQVVIYTSKTYEIGGLETFIYSFCKQMSKYYDIMVLYDQIAINQLGRLMKICRCVKNDLKKPISCDTIIINRISDKIPANVNCKQSVQMTHCIKQQNWHIPQDKTYIVNVSQASKNSFGEEAMNGIVINNLTVSSKTTKALLLVSAMRVGADDKQGNDARCVKFANMLDRAGIEYMWLYFGDRPMINEPKNMLYAGMKIDMRPYIARADYLVQLSGKEAFSYSLLEALELHTPVIVTPLEQNKDMQIKDGENAYIVPFDVEGFDVSKLLKIPKFKYKHDNEAIIQQWRSILGNTKPTGAYKPSDQVAVNVLITYNDLRLDKTIEAGSCILMDQVRAAELQNKGLVKILEE